MLAGPEIQRRPPAHPQETHQPRPSVGQLEGRVISELPKQDSDHAQDEQPQKDRAGRGHIKAEGSGKLPDNVGDQAADGQQDDEK